MRKLRALHVEDDPDIRHIVKMALSLDPAIRLKFAESAADALRVLAHGAVPDVVLLDVMMPGVDGPALLDLLRAEPRTATLPVIFLTAKARAADVAAYIARGAIGVVEKPFDPLTLAARIRAMVDPAPTA